MNRGGTTIVLVPTEIELQLLRPAEMPSSFHFQCCGFGPLSAAIQSMKILRQADWDHVILAGFAGSYDIQRFPLGTTYACQRTSLDGIGILVGDQLQCGYQLGFDRSLPPLIDQLVCPPFLTPCPLLLTVCQPSYSSEEAAQRSAHFTTATLQEVADENAALEDMEGYAVAAVCRELALPLTILRTVSNAAGDRDKSRWQFAPAMASLRNALLEWNAHR